MKDVLSFIMIFALVLVIVVACIIPISNRSKVTGDKGLETTKSISNQVDSIFNN